MVVEGVVEVDVGGSQVLIPPLWVEVDAGRCHLDRRRLLQ